VIGSIVQALPVRHKLALITTVAITVSMGAACAVFLANDRYSMRAALVRDAGILADIIVANSTAAVTFGDAVAATETLAALSAEPQVRIGCVYSSDGALLARYRRRDQATVGCADAAPSSHGAVFADTHLEVTRPIRIERNAIGHVALTIDLADLEARQTRQATILLVATLVTSMLAYALAHALQGLITAPLLHLVSRAREVTDKKDYAVRAHVETHDELGVLGTAFNEMLEVVQDRDLALRRSERHFRSLIEHASDIITILDRSGRIRYASPSVERVLGHAPDDLIGRPVLSLVHETDRRLARRAFAEVVASSAPVTHVEMLCRHADGSWRVLEAACTNLLDTPETAGVVVNSRDVTERRASEEQLRIAKDEAIQASRAKSAFVASMSHELRTPLNAIIGYSEILQEDAAAGGWQGALTDLGRIHGAGRHLLALINDVLDLSKVEAGRLDVTVETFRVRDCIDDVVATARALADGNRNELEVQVSPGVGTMRSDLTRVRQILINLLGNACKFTFEGCVTLQVSRQDSPRGDVVVFRVIDTGIGISAEQQARLFQDFTQGDAETTRRYGGTGLGLSLCRRLAVLLGGTVTVQSTLKQGATFEVRLPARYVAGTVAGQPAA
jgi:PAS domain S-box-containing protein